MYLNWNVYLYNIFSQHLSKLETDVSFSTNFKDECESLEFFEGLALSLQEEEKTRPV